MKKGEGELKYIDGLHMINRGQHMLNMSNNNRRTLYITVLLKR